MDTWFWVVTLFGAALVAKVRELYRKGDKLGAVKALRAATGLSLADAIRIADKLGATAKPAPAKDRSGTGELPPITSTIGPDHDDELRSMVAAGQQIEAIKMVRTLTGMGLKDAKDYVDRLPPG